MTDIATRASVTAIDGLLATMVEIGLLTLAQIDREKPRTKLYEILIPHLRGALYAEIRHRSPEAMAAEIERLQAIVDGREPELPLTAEGPTE